VAGWTAHSLSPAIKRTFTPRQAVQRVPCQILIIIREKKMRAMNFILLAGAGLGSALAAIQSAHAETEAVGLDEIIVTAQKRAENINDVPLTIQAFSGASLRRSGVGDVTQLSQLTSGLNFARSGGNTPIFTLRGIGFNTPNLSSTSPVGIYADEVAYAYPYMANGPFFDMERVEILKGPQGTLYGRNTTGGLINFIAAKPTSELTGRVAAELGNYDTYNFEGFISAPLTDGVGIRLSGRWENSDKGWQRSITRNERLGERDRLGLRAIIAAQLSDRLKLDLNINFWRDRSDTVAGQGVRIIPNNPAFLLPEVAASVRPTWKAGQADWDPVGVRPAPLSVRSDFYSISGRVTYDLNDELSLISLTAYNHLKRQDGNDVDGTAQQVFSYTTRGKIRSFSQELRLNGEYERFNFIIGGYYSRDKVRDYANGHYDKTSVLQFLRFLSQNVIDPTNALYTAEQYAVGFRDFQLNIDPKSRSLSAFGNLSYKVTDAFTLTAGLRFTSDKSSNFGCSRDLNGNTIPVWNTAVRAAVLVATGIFPPNAVGVNGCLGFHQDFGYRQFDPNDWSDLNEENLAGRLSAQYEFDNGSMVYATISRGFKSGAYPLIPTNLQSQTTPANQEEVLAYELGLKANLADGAGQINISAFYYDYKDKQLFSEVPDIVFTTLTRILNIPESEVAGVEGEFTWRLPVGIQAQLGLAYTHSEVKRYDGFARDASPLDFRGARFSNTPSWQINGALNYSGEVTNAMGIRANINASYQSSTSSSLIDEAGYEIDGCTLVNANIGLFSLNETWDFGVFAKNLFNKGYWTSANYYGDVVYRVPGQTRTYGITLSYRF
jgi:iron complex outermembrane recepter protein